MELSERLSALRKEKGLTLRELAEQVGITAAALSSYEKGQKEPSLGYAKKLAQYYGVSLDYLCGDSSDEKDTKFFYTCADVVRAICVFLSCGNGQLNAENTCVSGEAAAFDSTSKWNFEIESFTEKNKDQVLSLNLQIVNSELMDFLNVLAKLSSLTLSNEIPQSVVDDWLKTNIKKMRAIQLADINSQEEFVTGESRKPYLTATSKPISKE